MNLLALILVVGNTYLNGLGQQVTIVGRGFVGQSAFTYEGCLYNETNKRKECTFYSEDGRHNVRPSSRDLTQQVKDIK